MMKIAIDCGHGYTKGLSESGERVLFPSLICPAVSDTDLGDFSIKSQDKIWLDDQLFLVGESARLHALPLWGRDKAADQDSFRLMLVAAAKLGASGPIRLGAGLPLAWYGTQRKAVKEALTGYGSMVSLPDQPSRRIWIEDVALAPQGVAAAVSIFFTPSVRDESWIVLDIGYRTTDFCWVDRPRDAMMSFEPSRAGTIEVGYHDVVHAVSTEMEKTYHLPFRESELESLTTVIVRGQTVDVSALTRMAAQSISVRLAQDLTLRLGDALERVSGILLIGGAAAQFDALFPWPTRVANDSQWANAIGYLSLLD